MSETTSAVFDVARPISIKLFGPGGQKAVEIRFPTDAEWIECNRHTRIIIRSFRDGSKESTVSKGADDAAMNLLDRIRADKESGPEIDSAEAAAILARLSRAEVEDVVLEGPEFQITLLVPGARTIHRLRIPSEAAKREYGRGALVQRELPRNLEERWLNLDAAGALYDQVISRVEGYAAAPPIVHKAAVVTAMLEELLRVAGSNSLENF